jgi:hypothetical protein
MVVKNAIISGVCSVVSNFSGISPQLRIDISATATSSPPSTGAGRL